MTKRRRVGNWFLGIGLSIAICGYVAFRYSDLGQSSASLEAQLEAARREGLPVDYTAFHPAPIPDHENAARPFLKATFAAYGIGSLPPKSFEESAMATPSGRRAAMSKLSPFGGSFAQMERAVQKPRLVLDRHYEAGPALEFKEIAGFKYLVRALSWRATVTNAEGDWRSALSDLRTAAKGSALLRDEPTMYIAHVRSNCENQVLQALQQVLAKHSHEPRAILEARRLMRELGPLPEIRRAIGIEAVSSRTVIRYLVRESQKPVSPGMMCGGIYLDPLQQFEPVIRAKEANTVAFWREIYRSIPRDPTDYLEAADRWQAIAEEVERRTGPAYSFATLSMPCYSSSLRNFEAMRLRRRLAVNALRLFEVRNKTGSFPPALAATGEETRDSFARRPLTYLRTESGFLLYSVGVNGRDEGGQDRSTGSGPRPDDLAFRYSAM